MGDRKLPNAQPYLIEGKPTCRNTVRVRMYTTPELKRAIIAKAYEYRISMSAFMRRVFLWYFAQLESGQIIEEKIVAGRRRIPYHQTPEHKAKIAAAMKGNQNRKGKYKPTSQVMVDLIHNDYGTEGTNNETTDGL